MGQFSMEISSVAGSVLNGNQQFSILEPAKPPEDAIRPNRRRIAGLGIAGGLGVGLGLIVLLEILNKTVRRPTELAQKLRIQPLATIPFIAGPRELRPARRFINAPILSTIFMLIIITITGFYAHNTGIGSKYFEKIFPIYKQ